MTGFGDESFLANEIDVTGLFSGDMSAPLNADPQSAHILAVRSDTSSVRLSQEEDKNAVIVVLPGLYSPSSRRAWRWLVQYRDHGPAL